METTFKTWKHFNVYRDGRIFDTKKNRLARQYKVSSGYRAIFLEEDGIRKNYLVHRIVAGCFIENVDDKPHVNHKDTDKTNNHVDNLEWIYPRENSIHYHRTRKTKYPTGVHRNQNGTIYGLIQHEGININIGSYESVEIASLVYNAVAKVLTKIKGNTIQKNNKTKKVD